MIIYVSPVCNNVHVIIVMIPMIDTVTFYSYSIYASMHRHSTGSDVGRMAVIYF